MAGHGVLHPLEITGVLLRDIVAALSFTGTLILRRPVAGGVAEAALGVLRRPTVKLDGRKWEERYQRHMMAIRRGDLVEMAVHLRELLGESPPLVEGQQRMLEILSQLVLDECELVLAQAPGTLGAELRARFPATMPPPKAS